MFVLGGGGPTCKRMGSHTIRCGGEVDEGKRFAGRIELDGDPCDADVRVKVSAAAAHSEPNPCDDIGLTDARRLQPKGC